MIISDLKNKLQLEDLIVIDPERNVSDFYTGDHLSSAVAKLKSDVAWITIMDNVNVIAVASLGHASCVIFSDDTAVSKDVIKTAKQEGISLFKTPKSSFEISFLLGKLFYEGKV